MSIILRGIDFGSVFTASGTLNFFGQGYPYHKYYKLIPGFSFNGSTFVAKTTTIFSRAGNMPLDEDLQPKEFRPKCIYVDFLKGLGLNAVSLSGPGAQKLLATGLWQEREKPFFISFMAVGANKLERLEELRKFCWLLNFTEFRIRFGLEINLSCPNTKHNPKDLITEAAEMIKIANYILKNIPIIIKISVLIDPLMIKQIIAESNCDAVAVSNTIPWGQLPDKIDWEGLFGSKISPLQEFGGGGFSGKHLLTLVRDWISEARNCGIETPIIGGGGIFCKKDVATIKYAGADAIFIGTVAMLRPWRVQGIINYANKIYQEGGARCIEL